MLDLQGKIQSGGTIDAREFKFRVLSDGPPRFDEQELQRIRDRNGLQLQPPDYDPIH